jgi:SAM-dependent methyltransferase
VQDSYAAIVVHRCNVCQTVQLDQPYDEAYADDYQRNTSFSPSALGFMRENVDMLVSCFADTHPRRALEIGCGDGTFLGMLAERFEVQGVEPSRAAAELARTKTLDVRNEYFDPAAFDRPFDVVASRFVLEHIFEPHAFIEGIKRVLKPGGLLLLEVPNYDLQRKDARFFEFYREHVFYFDAHTLVGFLYRHGFSLVKSRVFMKEEYLIAIFEHAGGGEAFTERHVDISRAFADMLADPTVHAIACWGASGGGVSLLSYSGVDATRIRYLVDSDPNKHGLYVYGTGLQVRQPSVLAEDAAIDAVIIMSPTYETEIARTLREQYGFVGRIGSIKGLPHWVG